MTLFFVYTTRWTTRYNALLVNLLGNYFIYDLFAAINHHGENFVSGHYTACVRYPTAFSNKSPEHVVGINKETIGLDGSFSNFLDIVKNIQEFIWLST